MRKKLLTLFLSLFAVANLSMAQTSHIISLPQSGEKAKLQSGWIAKNSSNVLVDGNTLTRNSVDQGGWIEATVPGTVLTTLLNNGLIPDPMFSMNNNLIPDIYDTGNDHYTYWFVNQFNLDSSPGAGERVWLNFRGINYKAEIFLNGKRVNGTTHEGMFLRQSYDVTSIIRSDSTNILGVIVYPPTYPGKPGGQGGDGYIARNNTMQYTPGWDWIQPVRDRNTGIWDEVTITKSGEVTIDAPYVVTSVPGVREPKGKQKDAYINSTIEVKNNSSETVSGRVVCATDGQTLEMAVTLAPKEVKTIEFAPITIKNPKLWWPNGIGDQPLSDIVFTFKDSSGSLSDKESVRYGIRELTTDKDPKTGGRRFWVNGQKVYVTGGNYINSDWMLRLSPERYDAEVRFHKEMNLRMIRVWGGALTERPEFYEACDKYGIMVFQDLWTSGDCNGAWEDPNKRDSRERRMEYPDNHDLFLRSAEDQIKMLRNHASLALWCGGNEWPTAKDLDEALKDDIMPRLDPLRTFASFSTDTLFTRNTQGGNGDGPYGIQEPEWFYTVPNASPFNPEAGSVGSPEVEGMRRMMREEELEAGIKAMQMGGRPHTSWSYHKDLGYKDHLTRYGQVTDIETYCKYAQVVNYDQYRYFMEAWAAGMWSKYTGILIWKTQNPWTSLRGQMYDVFLDVNASLYGTQKGCLPLHAQYNIITREVQLPNTSLESYNGLSVEAEVYSLDSKLLWSKKVDGVDRKANSVETLFEVADPSGEVEGAYFINLILTDKDGNLVDENTYWATTIKNDYTKLADMPKSKADISVERSVEGDNHHYTLTIKSGSGISFFNRVKLFSKSSGEQILPVHFSDNYITVMPGREKSITIDFQSKLAASDIEVVTQSWTAADVTL